LASTNPVHSLSNLFEQNVFGKVECVCDEEKCYAFEIDTRDTIERSKKEIREKINWFLKFADITTKAEDFIESATMNPAFEESCHVLEHDRYHVQGRIRILCIRYGTYCERQTALRHV
jgi:arsenite/tail-anchored protein-transporting ATPase